MLSPTKEGVMTRLMDRKTLGSWIEELEVVHERIAPRFARSEVRQRANDYLRGLLASVERKNGWQLAEAAGNATPYGLQHLLGRANWDADLVRDDLREYVLEHLGEEGLLIVDETGFIKKGQMSVGVKRQYTGTVGKRENCQVGVFLAYASEQGQAFIDRELYLPEEWAQDEERRVQAGVPEQIGMRTKPELAKEMLGRALVDGGVKAAWVVADSVYGDTRRLGMFLEEKEQPYVLAVSGKAHVWSGFHQHRVSTLLDALREGELPPEEAREGWKRLSAGEGSKGPRLYDWLRLPLNPPLQEGFERWLLVRRSIEDQEELTAYTVFSRAEGTPLEALARAAGGRWQVEIGFEEAKGEVGLAHYEVRSWHGWYRHITLALFAHAFLATIRADGIDIEPSQKGGPKTEGTDSLLAFKRKRGLWCR